jgi:hypothetical protein
MRRWAVILCVAVVLLAALTHPGIGLPVAVLTPLFLFAIVLGIPTPRLDEDCDLWFPVLPLFSPRPPPLQ